MSMLSAHYSPCSSPPSSTNCIQCPSSSRPVSGHSFAVYRHSSSSLGHAKLTRNALFGSGSSSSFSSTLGRPSSTTSLAITVTVLQCNTRSLPVPPLSYTTSIGCSFLSIGLATKWIVDFRRLIYQKERTQRPWCRLPMNIPHL